MLTPEQMKLRRTVLIKNARIENVDEYFDKMLQGGEFCIEQLKNWDNIFRDDEVKALRKKAQEINDQADALEQEKMEKIIT